MRGRKAVLTAALAVAAALALSSPSPARADDSGPYVFSTSPAAETQVSEETTRVGINPNGRGVSIVAVVDDPDGIQLGSQLLSIAAPGVATVTASPALTYVSGTGETKAELRYAYKLASMPEKTYTVTLTIKDKGGRLTVYSWRYSAFDTTPHVNSHTPGRDAIAASPEATVSANISGGKSAVVASSVVMKVDETTVTPSLLTWGSYQCAVTWAPPSPLAEGPHVARLSYQNVAGIASSYAWSFYVSPGQPAFSSISPAPGSTVAVDAEGRFDVVALVQDLDGLSTGPVTFTLDPPEGGSQVTSAWPMFRAASSRRQADASARFTATSEEGTYTVTASASDASGREGARSWDFRMQPMPPVFDQATPASTADSKSFIVSIRIRDFGSGVDRDSIDMTFDGSPVAVETSTVAGGYVVWWDASAMVADNTTHRVSVSASDGTGVTGSRTWDFDVRAVPQVSDRRPSPDSVFEGEDVGISFRLSEPDDGIDLSSIRLTFDGSSLTPTVSADASATSADVSAIVRNVGGSTLHTVTVEAKDERGHRLNDSWSFLVSPPRQGDLLDMTNTPCQDCHVGLDDFDQWNEVHWVVGDAPRPDWKTPSTRASHKYNCNICHYSKWDPAQGRYVGEVVIQDLPACGLCHQAPGGQYVKTGTHGGNGDAWFRYRFRDHDDGSKYAKTSPEEGRDCVYCHQGLKGTGRIDNFSNGGTTQAHDIVAQHRIEFDDPKCAECHSAVLTREHSGDDRTDESGNKLSCGSCHAKNARQAVKENAWVPESLRLRFWGTVDSAWNTSPVPTAPPGEPPYSAENGGEFGISGSQLLSARLRLVSSAAGTLTIDGLVDGQWRAIHEASVGGEGDQSPGGNFAAKAFPVYAEKTERVTFPQGTSKVRMRYQPNSPGYNYVSANLGEWDYTGKHAVKCGDCHDGGGHEAGHETTLNESCRKCHDLNLQKEHVNEQRGVVCTDCHDVSDTARQAISFGQRSCSDCHEVAHGINFASNVPTDIPQHPQLKWSQPIPSTLFVGESWLPTDAPAAKLVFSARKAADPSPAEMWSWSSSELTSRGWERVSSAPSGDHYAVEFRKSDRHAVVYCYRGAGHLASPAVGEGYRYELMWWSD